MLLGIYWIVVEDKPLKITTGIWSIWDNHHDAAVAAQELADKYEITMMLHPRRLGLETLTIADWAKISGKLNRVFKPNK